MKKTYQAPAITVVDMLTENGLLAGSNTPHITIDSNNGIDAGDAFAGKGGWNSADWSETEE